MQFEYYLASLAETDQISYDQLPLSNHFGDDVLAMFAA